MPSIRVLIAKVGLDGHEAGAKLVAMALRDAGMEVIYTGPRQTPEAVVRVALQEDVDVIGLSILSGAHIPLCRQVVQCLEKAGAPKDVRLIVGGIVPTADVPALLRLGVDAVFGPGTKLTDIVTWIQRHARAFGGV